VHYGGRWRPGQEKAVRDNFFEFTMEDGSVAMTRGTSMHPLFHMDDASLRRMLMEKR
jgi:hypothetical protein